jgi:chemotaxis regulatin CheY-phosphate phosphatase CheZ
MGDVEKAKKARIVAKAALTRTRTSAHNALGGERPLEEVIEAESKFRDALEDVIKKHEEYRMFLDLDKIDDEAPWIEQIVEQSDELSWSINDYKSNSVRMNSFSLLAITAACSSSCGMVSGLRGATLDFAMTNRD